MNNLSKFLYVGMCSSRGSREYVTVNYVLWVNVRDKSQPNSLGEYHGVKKEYECICIESERMLNEDVLDMFPDLVYIIDLKKGCEKTEAAVVEKTEGFLS